MFLLAVLDSFFILQVGAVGDHDAHGHAQAVEELAHGVHDDPHQPAEGEPPEVRDEVDRHALETGADLAVRVGVGQGNGDSEGKPHAGIPERHRRAHLCVHPTHGIPDLRDLSPAEAFFAGENTFHTCRGTAVHVPGQDAEGARRGHLQGLRSRVRDRNWRRAVERRETRRTCARL